jgi:hypothetical protein
VPYSFINMLNAILFADKDDVVMGLIYRNYNIFVVYSVQDFCSIGIFEYRCCFCALSFPTRICINKG